MIVFAAQDAGPAAYLAEVAQTLGARATCLASPVAAPAFSRRGLAAMDLREAPGLLDRADVSGVVTGTCLGPSVEKDLARRAASSRRRSISVVEHWSNYRERFEDQGTLVLPDFILVNDELARAGAAKAGLPADRLRALGNPVLERAAAAAPARVTRARWLASLGLPAEGRVVVFVSEEMSRLWPGLEPGFDEHQALADLRACLAPEDHLLIHLHPAERANKYAGLAARGVPSVSTLDPAALALHADKIVGMGSMLLLEAAVFRGDVISHRPGQRYPFVGNEVGATRLVETREALRRALGRPRLPASGWAAGFLGSKARIAAFLAETLS